MKRSKRNHKPNRAARNAVTYLKELGAEIDLLQLVIADGGGNVAGYVDRHGTDGAEFYGDDRAALRKVEREFTTLTAA